MTFIEFPGSIKDIPKGGDTPTVGAIELTGNVIYVFDDQSIWCNGRKFETLSAAMSASPRAE